MTKQTVNINIIAGSAKPVVHVSQYDHDAGALVFNIYDGDTEFSIPPDATIIMQGTKPNKQFFLYQCDGFSGNTVTCSVHDQMTAVAGNVECELRIYSGGNGIGTANFTLSVEHAAVADDSVTSADTLTALSEIENTVIASRDSAASSASAAAKSAKSATQAAKSAIDMVYPVGSIYMSVNSTNPASLFGGTWEQIKDRFLLAAGDTYSAGSTGGEAQHTLTVDEMPEHRHLPYVDGSTDSSSYRLFMGSDAWYNDSAGTSQFRVTGDYNTRYKGFEANTNSVGGSQPHNNMPPYLTVYMWKRTA